MNIDVRIEAPVQSVELLYLNSRDSDRRTEERDRQEAEDRAEFRRQMAEFAANSDRLWKLYTSHERNLTMHEQRLDQHDDRLHKLDGGRIG